MKRIEKILFKIIDKEITNVDTYYNSGSLWLIFTDEKKWVVEFTDSGVLWFNYSFFNDIFSWIGLTDKKEEYIKKWFEERFLFKPKIEDTIQNGVKDTCELDSTELDSVEDTIQNGVKDITYRRFVTVDVEDTIQNGVKRTLPESIPDSFGINDAIQNGVKHTSGGRNYGPYSVEETIQNGVKNTFTRMYSPRIVEDTIQNGVKEIYSTLRRTILGVDDILKNGIKETKSMGGKKNGRVDNTIENGVKHCEDGDWLDGDERIDKIVENGLKV